MEIFQKIRQMEKETLSKFRIRVVDMEVLCCIQDGVQRNTAIAKKLGLSTSVVTHCLKPLQNANLVSYEISKMDERKRNYSITEAGIIKADEFRHLYNKYFSTF